MAGWRRELEALPVRGADGALHPASVISALADVLAPTDVVVADTGYMAAWVGALYPVRAHGRHVLRAARSAGRSQRRSARRLHDHSANGCVIGDGGIGYHVAELETAVRCGIPVVVVVLNNRSFAFEYHLQKFLLGRVVSEVNDFAAPRLGVLAKRGRSLVRRLLAELGPSRLEGSHRPDAKHTRRRRG